uniref:Uncharacterized protein n=1 Tax=Lotharella oceanica TaxID=641309 RepID=A0A7S2XHA1_9EUKA
METDKKETGPGGLHLSSEIEKPGTNQPEEQELGDLATDQPLQGDPNADAGNADIGNGDAEGDGNDNDNGKPKEEMKIEGELSDPKKAIGDDLNDATWCQKRCCKCCNICCGKCCTWINNHKCLFWTSVTTLTVIVGLILTAYFLWPREVELCVYPADVKLEEADASLIPPEAYLKLQLPTSVKNENYFAIQLDYITLKVFYDDVHVAESTKHNVDVDLKDTTDIVWSVESLIKPDKVAKVVQLLIKDCGQENGRVPLVLKIDSKLTTLNYRITYDLNVKPKCPTIQKPEPPKLPEPPKPPSPTSGGLVSGGGSSGGISGGIVGGISSGSDGGSSSGGGIVGGKITGGFNSYVDEGGFSGGGVPGDELHRLHRHRYVYRRQQQQQQHDVSTLNDKKEKIKDKIEEALEPECKAFITYD